MYKVAFLTLAAWAVSQTTAQEPLFSIGLGTLSPSYSQIVGQEGKDSQTVKFLQKENGISYTVSNPNTGTTSYYNFGPGSNPGLIIPEGLEAENVAAVNPQSQNFYAVPAPEQGRTGPQPFQPIPLAPVKPQSQIFYSAPAQAAAAVAAEQGRVGSQPFQTIPLAANPEGPIVPAGFSYHGLEGQAFSPKAVQPDFVVDAEPVNFFNQDQQQTNYNQDQQQFNYNQAPAQIEDNAQVAGYFAPPGASMLYQYGNVPFNLPLNGFPAQPIYSPEPGRTLDSLSRNPTRLTTNGLQMSLEQRVAQFLQQFDDHGRQPVDAAEA